MKPAKPAPQLPKPATLGKWQITRETSSIDNSKTVSMIQPAEGVVYDRYGDSARLRLAGYFCDRQHKGDQIKDWFFGSVSHE